MNTVVEWLDHRWRTSGGRRRLGISIMVILDVAMVAAVVCSIPVGEPLRVLHVASVDFMPFGQSVALDVSVLDRLSSVLSVFAST